MKFRCSKYERDVPCLENEWPSFAPGPHFLLIPPGGGWKFYAIHFNALMKNAGLWSFLCGTAVHTQFQVWKYRRDMLLREPDLASASKYANTKDGALFSDSSLASYGRLLFSESLVTRMKNMKLMRMRHRSESSEGRLFDGIRYALHVRWV